MSERLVLASWFALGIGLQVPVLIRGHWNWGRLAGCVGIGFIGMLPGRNEHEYQPLVHILYSLGIFSCALAMMFKDDILPVVSERILLLYSLVFWFAFFSYFYHGTTLHKVLVGVLLIPSVATVVIVFERPQLNFLWKIFLYTWFLCTVVSLGLIQFPFHHLSIFLSRQDIPWVTPLDCIVAGMAFLYLAVNMAYLYELIPIQGKNQSWQDRMKQWHELTNLMTRRVEDDQPTHLQSLVLLVGVGGALLLIYFFHWLPSGLAINILIVLPCFLALGRGSSTAADALSQIASARLPGVKAGRNDPCVCGSGKKFKYCCGAPGAVSHDAPG